MSLTLHWLISPLTDLVITFGAKVFYSISGSEISCRLKERIFLFVSRRPAFEASVSLRDITVNQPILWALILASPGIRIFNRIKKISLGTGILIVSHLIFLLCKVELTLIEAGHPMAESLTFWSSFDNFLEITGKGFFPVAIWLALTFNYLLGDIDRKNIIDTKQVGRNDPCPCGSGKKHKNCCLRKC